jgi:hypothetical protein
MDLKLVVASPSPTLQTNGEVYRRADILTGPPVVNDVTAFDGKDALFALEAGKYVYDFAIQNGKGSVTVSVIAIATNTPVATDTFDTKDGYFANDLQFEVK